MSELTDADMRAIKRTFFIRPPGLTVVFALGVASAGVLVPHFVSLSTTLTLVWHISACVFAALAGVSWSLKGVQHTLRELNRRYPNDMSDLVVGDTADAEEGGEPA